MFKYVRLAISGLLEKRVLLFQIERASTADLWSLASLLIIGGLMYALSGYFKSVILALKLPGPPTVPFFGNCLLVKERDRKLRNCFQSLLFVLSHYEDIIKQFDLLY